MWVPGMCSILHVYPPQENVLKKAQELTAEQCNSLQKSCIEKAAKRYKRDEFASGMYVHVYLVYLLSHLHCRCEIQVCE